MQIDPTILGLAPQMTAWRRDFHAHPETAYQEVRTAARVAELLASFGCKVATGLAGTGVVGTLQGRGARQLMLRADMDALPMREEAPEREHRSQNEGKMHGCGHDGHMAMLLGAAAALAKTGGHEATLHFLFQPAEENEAGAKRLVDEGLFNRFQADAVFGLHNWPGLPQGQMAVRTGPAMASCDLLEITLVGKGAHAAMPHQGRDVVLAGAHIVSALQGLVARETDPVDSAVVSITQFEAGSAWNVMPEKAVLRGTLRALVPDTRDRLETRLRRMVESIAEAFDVKAQVSYDQRYPATVNDAKQAALAARAAVGVLGEANVRTDLRPSMGSEDFAFLLNEKPGAYAWLGSGRPSGSGLHSPTYDFNDEVLPIGAAWWVELATLFQQTS